MTLPRDPSILAIVLNYRTPDLTLRAADTALSELAGLRSRLIIVDNASGDGSEALIAAEIARRDWDEMGVELLQSGHNGGFGAGNNAGIRQGMATGIDGAPPDYIYILNSDAFPDSQAIRRLVEHLEATPECGLAGSYIHGPDGKPHMTAFRFPSIPGEFEGAARIGPLSRMLERHIVPLPVPRKTTRVDWLAGASLMIRREVLEEIGLFDERYFLYFEETDLCLRAFRAGWRTDYVRESEVTHIGSVSTGMKDWARMPQYWFDSRLHYFNSNHGAAYAALATLAHVLGASLYRLRCLIDRRKIRDPDRFLRDLIAHALRAPFRKSETPGAGIPPLLPPVLSRPTGEQT
ncbi:hypothetical protein SAMN04490248_10732 [Salinihabitans flavidus]|uniref:Glycosyltransferase 2-like domain-containing protein n=1 Tax=Salinihabitans flavidus TaxID=569882 RepID=A0A1H8QSZ2_9RHOB|nr:glycosyltransferase family 2 protein [Salinihabitans flavidus]SEO57295.1 hypothetical protein SAMN04490248_10732 [Salinihabitans flavidus]